MSADIQRLRKIYQEAAGEEMPEARATYLDRACEGDAELRAAVERLFEAETQAGDFLETPVMPAVGAPIYEKPGSVIGRYKLLEQIGEGAFGLVFMAEQTEPVRRKVALKIIKAGMDTKEVMARFAAERQALAMMEHPNIARVFDAGSTETGRPYFVMELIQGIAVTKFCDERKLSTRERLDLFGKVCHAVQHAHQKGIIHRDLKPSNILVTLIDGEPVPKIIDFGVAKALGEQLTDNTLFTGFLRMVGTPAYMSPEQADLSGVDIDTRADIYALGVLLYELLTGVTPFDGETLRNAALDEIRRMIREVEPPKPSTRLDRMGVKLTDVATHRRAEPGALSRLVQGDLDWIVMKCLEKERGRRYETADALLQDVQRHLDVQPVQAGPPSMGYRLRKFARRHRAGVVMSATATMALVAGLTMALVGFVQARRERDRAVSAEAQAEHLAREESAQRQRAESSAEVAQRQREVADANLRMARINQIQHHLGRGEVGPALALLEEQRPTLNMHDSRSLAWRHLWRRAHQGHRSTLCGHEGRVMAVAFVPDKHVVVSGGDDGTVRLWDVADGVLLETLARSHGAISCVAVSPDAKTLAWGYAAGDLVVWDLDARRLRYTIQTAPLASLDFSPDAQILAGGGIRGSVRLWKAETGEDFGQPHPSDEGRVPSAVAFSPDGQVLACANLKYAKVTLLDLGDMEEQAQLSGHGFWVRSLAFSADGKTLVSGGNNPTVKVWDPTSTSEKSEFMPNVRMPFPLAISPDGQLVAVGGWCGTVEVRDVASGRTRSFGHVGKVSGLAFSSDGETLASASEDGTVKLWDMAPGQDSSPLKKHKNIVWTVAYSPDGRVIATAGGPEPILWDAATGQLLRDIPVGACASVAFSPSGKVLAIRGSLFWDIEAQQLIPRSIEGGLAAAFSADGKVLAAGGKDGHAGMVRLWDWRAGQKLATFKGHTQWVWSVAFSPDGQTMASASAQGTSSGEVILWETDSGERKRTLELGCACVAFSPDGKLLASGSKSGGIALWDPESGELLRDMVGHVLFMEDMAFAPDGKTIVACNVQGGVTVWDVEQGIELATLSKPDHSVYSIGISPDGQAFATGGQKGTFEIWRTADEAEVRAQSAWFDPRLRIAQKLQDKAKALRMGSRPEDAQQALEQADRLYRQLAVEFPNRFDLRPSIRTDSDSQ